MCLINTLYTLTELFWDLGMPHQNRAQVGDPGSGFSKGSTKTGLGKCPLVCSKSPKRDIYRFFFDSKKVNVLLVILNITFKYLFEIIPPSSWMMFN